MRKLFLVLFIAAFFASVPAWSTGRQEIPEGTPSASSAEKKPAPVTLRIAALKGPSGFGMIRLFDTVPALGDGITSVYSTVPDPDIMVARLLSGETDIAALPTNVAAKLYNKGVPLVMGAVTGSGVLYLLSRSPDVKSFADLKGKTVYNTGKGSSPEFIFEYLLKKNGLASGQDVKVDYTYPHLELAQAFIAGRVDLAVLPEPFVTKVLRAVPGVTPAIDLQKAWIDATGGAPETVSAATGEETMQAPQTTTSVGSYPMTVVVIRKSVVEKYPAAVDTFLTAYRDSITWVNDNREPAGKLIEKFNFGLNAAEAADAVPRCSMAFVPAKEAQDAVSRFLSILLEFDPDSIGNRIPDGGFFYGN